MTNMTFSTPVRHTATTSRTVRKSDSLSYAIGESVLGKVLVARGSAGVCAILFGSSEQDLQGDLAARYPDGRISKDQGEVRDDLAQVIRHLDDPTVPLDFRLDPHGTPFQKRVWEAIGDVPNGATVTYSDLAERIGTPKAARAVAQACGANMIALAIPCHRVLRSDGRLGGYHWGVERKRELLRKEAAV